MNLRLLVFSSLITALVSAVLGLGVSRIAQSRFVSQPYRELNRQYAAIGAGIGLVAGAGLEVLRQMKSRRDEEEAQEPD